MPVILLLGIPAGLEDSEGLKGLILEKLPQAVAGIVELGLETKQVVTFAPRDLLQEGLGNEIIAFIDGLYTLPERTQEVKMHLAQAVCQALIEFKDWCLPECTMIEVFTRSLDTSSEGFASWEKKEDG